jgi:acetylserotonin N-methyltransferase
VALAIPICDDTPLWDVWLSRTWLPAVSIADDLGLFDSLGVQPASAAELAARLNLQLRAVEIVLPMLASLGFLMRRDGRFDLSETARTYLLHDGPFYWGHLFPYTRPSDLLYQRLKIALTEPPLPPPSSRVDLPVQGWENGALEPERARRIARAMHSHSLAAAAGFAVHVGLDGVTRLLDVGGGSGCVAIALAQRNHFLRATVLDLPAVCTVTREYIAAADLTDRVDVHGIDMFRQEWPAGHDAVLFSNVLHDWAPETCADLVARAYRALPSGGRIYVHEMLLDDSRTAPLAAAAFSVLMLLDTRGQQFTAGQISALLQDAGFVDIRCRHTYGYYSVLWGVKP